MNSKSQKSYFCAIQLLMAKKEIVNIEPGEFECNVQYLVDWLKGKWKVSIIVCLRKQEVVRFGEFQRLLPGISKNILAKQLDELESTGLICKTIFPEVPPRVEYRLTPMGNQLGPMLDSICAWVIKYKNLDLKD